MLHEHQRSLLPPVDMRIPEKKMKIAQVIVPVALTECIHPEVVSMVLPKNLNLTRVFSQRVTVREEQEFYG
jgi:hypothetical protein